MGDVRAATVNWTDASSSRS